MSKDDETPKTEKEVILEHLETEEGREETAAAVLGFRQQVADLERGTHVLRRDLRAANVLAAGFERELDDTLAELREVRGVAADRHELLTRAQAAHGEQIAAKDAKISRLEEQVAKLKGTGKGTSSGRGGRGGRGGKGKAAA